MLSENEAKIFALLSNNLLAAQVIEIVREDEAQRHAILSQRQREGLQRAKERGVRLGRPPAKQPRKFPSVYASFCNKEISARTAAQMLNVAPGTFMRWVQAKKSAGGN